MLDPSLIPDGPYCYRVELKEESFVNGDVRRYGKELREFSHHGQWKAILCPYWHRTEHGTIRCEYVGDECLDDQDPEARDKCTRYFSVRGMESCQYSSWLGDECKICGVREQWPEDQDDAPAQGDNPG